MGSLATILGSTYANPVLTIAGNINSILTATTGPWRPPQWGQPDPSRLTLIVPVSTNLTLAGAATGSVAYVFDLYTRADHDQQSVVTENPVQTGAAINDHVYTSPSTLVVELEMSDSMQSYIVGQFANNPSRSVSAYQILYTLQETKTLCQVATRLRTYSNMVIKGLRAIEDQESRYGLRATVTFKKILTASVQTTSASGSTTSPTSALQQITNSTLTGTNQAIPVPASITQANNIQNASATVQSVIASTPTPSAPGSWSSSNTNTIASVFG